LFTCDSLQLFTKSIDWFDDAKGWKSTQGGFSAIQAVTTDENNMGGFFVRKLAGGAAAAVQISKLLPFLAHEPGAKWKAGQFRPLLWTALIANIATIAFFGSYWDDLISAKTFQLPLAFSGALAIESATILYFLMQSRSVKREPAVAMPPGKMPNSPYSNIATRTVLIVTTAITVVAGRDLFFPGKIIDIIPRDDIYLEWTNALLHSPPNDSPEFVEQGLEAPLYIGDKFMSQWAALNILILCLFKYVVACVVRYGADGRGVATSKMMYKGGCIGDIFVLACCRFFTPAAQSASLDLRWHIMMVGYEAAILGLYGFTS
jgi:predicted secreted protein